MTISHEEFIIRANIVHKNKYKYPEKFNGIYKKIQIECPKHGLFVQSPSNHLSGYECVKCGIDAISISQEEFIEKANLIHNKKYKYIEQYAGANKKIQIECPIHGLFSQKASNHLSGHGCRKCGSEKCAKSTKMTNEEFLIKANNIHHSKYIYLNKYIGSRYKLLINCPTHGNFSQRAYAHLNGLGCAQCSYDTLKRTSKEFLDKVNALFNFKYKYLNIKNYVVDNMKIIIECPEHGIFKQSTRIHLQGIGCPRCRSFTTSKSETQWLNSLNIPQEYRYNRIKLGKSFIKPDAYDPKTNTIYEFYGDFWHGNPKIYDPQEENKAVKKTFGQLYKNTLKRERALKKAGYKLVFIWEDDWKKIQNEKANL